MENTQKFDVSVILPIKSGKANGFTEYFEKCIESLKNQKVGINELIIVHTNETYIVDYINQFDFGTLNVIKLRCKVRKI
jgi:glycosyltransferase involved in cell wall biosynthesis